MPDFPRTPRTYILSKFGSGPVTKSSPYNEYETLLEVGWTSKAREDLIIIISAHVTGYVEGTLYYGGQDHDIDLDGQQIWHGNVHYHDQSYLDRMTFSVCRSVESIRLHGDGVSLGTHRGG